MPATPAPTAAAVNSTEWAVSGVEVPATTGRSTAPATARQSSTFSSSERVGLSPVVPARTSPSLPWSRSQRASRTAPSTSRRPASSNGVATAPKRPAAITVRPDGQRSWPRHYRSAPLPTLLGDRFHALVGDELGTQAAARPGPGHDEEEDEQEPGGGDGRQPGGRPRRVRDHVAVERVGDQDHPGERDHHLAPGDGTGVAPSGGGDEEEPDGADRDEPVGDEQQQGRQLAGPGEGLERRG